MKKLFLFFLIPFAAFAQSGIPEATDAQITARQGIGYVSARRLPVGGGSDGTVLFGSASATGGSDGDTYIETDTGTVSKKAAGSWASQVQFQLYSSVLSTYAGIDPTANVQSLLGATDYSAFKALLTLGNVDNTSDATKNSATATLTNKRITARVLEITSSATPTINTDNYDAVTITALAVNITSMAANLSGTPSNFDKLIFRIKDDGTPRSINWDAPFTARIVALPTTTVANKILAVVFWRNSVTSTWDCMASGTEI